MEGIDPNTVSALKGLGALGGFNISMSEIIASLFFGVVGIYYFRIGRKEVNYTMIFLGLGLMLYPYVISGDKLVWLMGFGLWGAAYYFRRYG